MTWRPIEFSDIPTREEFERLTLHLLRKGVTNSDMMRDVIRQQRKLIFSHVSGQWNETPSGKFVNEHAWVLEQLMVKKIVKKIGKKEYELAA